MKVNPSNYNPTKLRVTDKDNENNVHIPNSTLIKDAKEDNSSKPALTCYPVSNGKRNVIPDNSSNDGIPTKEGEWS